MSSIKYTFTSLHALRVYQAGVIDGEPYLQLTTPGSSAVDLRVVTDYRIPSGARVALQLGVRIDPSDFWPCCGLLLPRTSLWDKYGLLVGNSIGLINADSCTPEDELFLMVANTSDSLVRLKAGQRVAQYLPIKSLSGYPFEYVESEDLKA